MLTPLLYVNFPNWIIGVLLASLGSFISNLGLNLQKLNHLHNNALNNNFDNNITDEFSTLTQYSRVYSPDHSYQNGNDQHTRIQSIDVQPTTDIHTIQHVDYTRQRLWQFGLALIVLGSVADFIALVYAAQSIVAPLGSLTLVSNTLLAPVLLKETISYNDIISTWIIVVGSALSVSFASHTDHILTIEQLLHLFTTDQFVIYIICISVICMLLYHIHTQFTVYKQSQPTLYVSYIRYHRFILAALSGIIGAQSILLAKVTAQLIANTVSGNSILFLHWQSYIVIVGLFAAIVTQMRILNTALQQFDALYIVPVFQAFWILFSVLSGMIFFNEAREVYSDAGRGTGFTFGVLLTICGVYFLSQRATDNDSGDVELSTYTPNGTRQTSIDTQSQYSYKSNSSNIDNMQIDLLLLPMLHQRHHRVFNSPPITLNSVMRPIDTTFLSTSAPIASPLLPPQSQEKYL